LGENAGVGSHDPITKEADAVEPRRLLGDPPWDPPLAVAYVIQARFGKAVKRLRSSLEAADLKIISETDLAESIRISLGMELAPSSLLSVTCPFLLLQVLVTDPTVLALLPLHIVAIEKDNWTRIYVLNPARLGSDVAGAFGAKLHELSIRIRECIDRVAARIPGGW
jgi:uncharacterized protein (DUF302 family)